MWLAIDTTLDRCSVALADGSTMRARIVEEMARGHAERLAPMVAEAMAATPFSALSGVAVTTGPGSFTGVRVGLAFARGLALALDVPAVGVSTLELLARQGGEAGLRAALIETPGGAYVALYEDGRPLLAPQAIEPEAAMDALHAASGGRPFALEAGRAPDPVRLAALARGRPASDHPAAPLYLRAPDAKLPA